MSILVQQRIVVYIIDFLPDKKHRDIAALCNYNILQWKQ